MGPFAGAQGDNRGPSCHPERSEGAHLIRMLRTSFAAVLCLESLAAGACVNPPLAHSLIPVPASIRMMDGDTFVIDTTSLIVIDPEATADTERVARFLADLIAIPAGSQPRRLAAGERPQDGSIYLRLEPDNATIPAEGYELTIAPVRVTLVARQGAGLLYGVQTIRQLLPTIVEHPAAEDRTLKLPAGRIADAPRYGWRGLMLDVSRHFLPVAEVKRYIDLMVLYKLNVLHLHLTDDQGWRLEIESWPKLTEIGARTQVGGRPSGFYTQEDYSEIVAYARERFIMVVPEIDMPGHTHAALTAYPELSCDGVPPPPYFGQGFGFSALCVDRDTVYDYVDDVIREVAALTPDPYLHIGGDEVERLTPEQYRRFIERAQAIVGRYGKRMIGWGDIAPVALLPETVVQKWYREPVTAHVARGGKVILSPTRYAYLDMKYDSTTMLGLDWAALIEVQDAYDWDPGSFDNIPATSVLGLEAALWSETVGTRGDFDYLAFPRLPALAEVAWSPQEAREWGDFRERLGAHGPRLSALGVNFYRSPQITWRR